MAWIAALKDWQDLVGAFAATGVAAVAVVISVLALRASQRQVQLGRAQIDLAREQDAVRRLGRENATRAALSPVLSNLAAWAEAAAQALGDLPMRTPVPRSARTTFAMPPLPKEEIDALVRMIEATEDADVIRRLSRFIGNIQVLTARASSIANPRRRHSLLPADVDVYLLDAVVIYAQASSLFPYARMARATVEPLTWKEVDGAMMSLTLYGPRFEGLAELARRRQESGREPETINDEA